MKRSSAVLLVLYSMGSLGLPLQIVQKNPHEKKTIYEKVDIKEEELKAFALDALYFRSFDEAAEEPRKLSFEGNTFRVEDQTIIKFSAEFDDIPVEAEQGILHFKENKQALLQIPSLPPAQGRFVLREAEALEKALIYAQGSLLINPYVEQIDNYSVRVWLEHVGSLRPAYRTRIPTLTLAQMQDIWIDAENGRVLKIQNSAQFLLVPAQVFTSTPDKNQPLEKSLKRVNLEGILQIEENGYLQGEHVQIRTCCAHFTCPDNETCAEENMRCALASHPNARQRRETIEIPTQSLGLSAVMSVPETLFVNTPRCAYLQFAKASPDPENNAKLGYFEVPHDGPDKVSDTDRFAEVQAYYAVSVFFQHIRNLLQDPKWCLRSQAMACDEQGRAILDGSNRPTKPYQVFVNVLMPNMGINEGASDPYSFVSQFRDNKGSKEDPISLQGFVRMGNAAFVPALNSGKKSKPRADELLADLIKSFDHNVFFQGDLDFAYDVDVVFHEFMHAVTATFLPTLNTLGLSPFGINAEPGSLNEGWSDYFAASLTGRSKIGLYAGRKDAFGESAMRDINNTMRCPDNTIGEIHNDSGVFSGALWELRTFIAQTLGSDHIAKLDQAALASLIKANSTESFSSQAQRLLEELEKQEGLGPSVIEKAKEIFLKRGVLNCFAAFPLSQVDNQNRFRSQNKPHMFVPSKNVIGLRNFAPGNQELEIAIPSGTKKMRIKWKQYLGGMGALLGSEVTPENASRAEPLGILRNFNDPIIWKFKEAKALAYNGTQLIDTENPPLARAEYRDGFWQYEETLNLNRCEQSAAYISFLGFDLQYILKDIFVEFESDPDMDLKGCQFYSTKQLSLDSLTSAEGCSSTFARGQSLNVGWLFLLLCSFLLGKIAFPNRKKHRS